MSRGPRAGRPRASSHETIAEAACELFLEQGYEQTSVADIAARAGVSRSSFFNYFASKGDILWSAFDQRTDAAIELLDDDAVSPRAALVAIADGFTPDALALGITNAEAMGIAAELERERAVRLVRLAHAVSQRQRREGVAPLTAEVQGAAAAGGVLAAVWAWAEAGPGRTDLASTLRAALDVVPLA